MRLGEKRLLMCSLIIGIRRKGIILDLFDDGEIVDGVPVWYDNNNEYFIPEL